MPKADYILSDARSFWICTPQTNLAERHLISHVSSEAQWWAGGVVVEHRYVGDLATALQARGFTVEIQ